MASGISKIVYEDVKVLRGEPASAVRLAVVAAFRSRGELDPSDVEVDLIVDAVRSSPLRVALGQARRAIGAASSLLGEVRRSAAPGWMASPADAMCVEWKDDEPTLFAQVKITSDCSAAVADVFRRAPNGFGHSTEPVDKQSVRIVECWCEATPPSLSDKSEVAVFVGKRRIGRLEGAGASAVRELLSAEATGRLAFEAIVRGATPSDGRIELEVPAR